MLGQPYYTLGLDLGRSEDRTALALIESDPAEDVFRLRGLHRFPIGTPNTELIALLERRITKAPLGAPFVDVFRDELPRDRPVRDHHHRRREGRRRSQEPQRAQAGPDRKHQRHPRERTPPHRQRNARNRNAAFNFAGGGVNGSTPFSFEYDSGNGLDSSYTIVTDSSTTHTSGQVEFEAGHYGSDANVIAQLGYAIDFLPGAQADCIVFGSIQPTQ
jgi:hypothetical protein